MEELTARLKVLISTERSMLTEDDVLPGLLACPYLWVDPAKANFELTVDSAQSETFYRIADRVCAMIKDIIVEMGLTDGKNWEVALKFPRTSFLAVSDREVTASVSIDRV